MEVKSRSQVVLFALALILTFFSAPRVEASDVRYIMHAEWSEYHPPSGYVVTGYCMYQDLVLVGCIDNPLATVIEKDVIIPAGKKAGFTLTAVFSNGIQSDHSAEVFLPADINGGYQAVPGAPNLILVEIRS